MGLLTDLKRLLKKKDLRSRWLIGQRLNQHTQGRAVYGKEAVLGIAGMLNASPTLLADCRRLAWAWDKDDLDIAVGKDLSFRSALRLLAFDSLAARLGDRGRFKKERQWLVSK